MGTWWRFHLTAERALTIPWTLAGWQTMSGASMSIADELIPLPALTESRCSLWLWCGAFYFPPILRSWITIFLVVHLHFLYNHIYIHTYIHVSCYKQLKIIELERHATLPHSCKYHNTCGNKVGYEFANPYLDGSWLCGIVFYMIQ